jgi:hypothetical protein
LNYLKKSTKSYLFEKFKNENKNFGNVLKISRILLSKFKGIFTGECEVFFFNTLIWFLKQRTCPPGTDFREILEIENS